MPLSDVAAIEAEKRPSAPASARSLAVASAITRLTWLTAARLFLYALLLAAVSALYLRADSQAYPVSLKLVIVTVALAFGAAGVYATWLRTRRALRTLAWTQVVVDQVIWTVLVYLSGGPLSGASAFYGLTCVLAAVTLGVSGSIVAAILGAALYLAVVFGFGFGFLKVPDDQPTLAAQTQQLVYPSLITVVALLVVATLAAYLARRVATQSGVIEEVTERAERAEKLAALGRVAAALAHEIRNPLGSIRGSIEIIREAPGLGEDERRLCEIIRSEADRLNDLVSDMMNLAKPRTPNLADADLGRIAADVVRLARQSGRAEQDVPIEYQGPASLVVRADPDQLRQVLWNLLRNAVQATGADGVVRVVAEKEKAGVKVSIVDHGAGIEPAARESIFDAFVTTRSHGIGIGLAVVKQIVDAHGATVGVEDTPGGGSTFVVRLPTASA